MLTLSGISKTYPTPAGALRVLDDVSLALETGEAAVITGPSGSGKSTLLYIAGGLEAPTGGSVDLDGTDPYRLAPEALARFRNREVGFVFQDHCLLPQLTVLENTLVPTLVGEPDADARDRARVLLTAVGLEPRMHHRPAQLSGGEKQRAAIARALIRSPRLLLCDEPTGNLDGHTADTVAELLLRLHVQQHTTMLVVTHSAALADRFPRRLSMAEGRLEPEPAAQNPGTVR
ncbi:MAG: ABC transporter ATP-binding protein [Gemmatimonadales bacterium]|nr:ABC transporter ATP-binding protein [Gemmatimonadales bacterium]